MVNPRSFRNYVLNDTAEQHVIPEKRKPEPVPPGSGTRRAGRRYPAPGLPQAGHEVNHPRRLRHTVDAPYSECSHRLVDTHRGWVLRGLRDWVA
jgi:hypothetical protein